MQAIAVIDVPCQRQRSQHPVCQNRVLRKETLHKYSRKSVHPVRHGLPNSAPLSQLITISIFSSTWEYHCFLKGGLKRLFVPSDSSDGAINDGNIS